MEEIWKIIKDAPNYSVSNLGRIKNNKTNYIRKTAKSEAYERVNIKCLDGKVHHKRIHRLVLETFDPKPNMADLVVNHKDGNHFNNKLENLEWTTQSENVKITWQRGRRNKNSDNNNNNIEYSDEYWIPIPGYKTYVISNYGRVKSLKHNRILNTNEINKYLYVRLMENDIDKKLSVHRLMMKSFDPREDEDKLQVNHIDGNKHNNKLENLEWCTGSENVLHCIYILGR
jgi:hypothetical protein